MNKCYSTDDETFSKDFPDDLEVGQIYYEADYTDINIEDYSKWATEHLLEYLDECLYEDVGEYADCDFSSVSQAAKQELKTFIEQWSGKHVNLAYFKVKGRSIEKIATEDDV